jgi:hypothetical protein
MGKGYFVSTVGINEEVIREDTSNHKKKKNQGKQSLSFERATSVKEWDRYK